MGHRTAWVLAGGGFVGLLWWGGHVLASHAGCAASIPVRPDIGDRPGIFGDRLNEAQARAAGWVKPTSGLGELGRLYHANGYFDAAERCYRGLIELEPHEARWPHLLGAILTGFGRLDEALPRLERVVTLAPEYTPAGLRLGDALLKTNRIDEAHRAYAAVLGREAQNPYALLGVARCRMVDNDWPGARDCLLRAVTAAPAFTAAWTVLVTVDERLGLVPAADASRNQARALGRFREAPDPWLDMLIEDCYDPYRLSVAAAASRDPATAQRWLERAIQLAPATGHYHRQLGDLLGRQNQFLAARAHLNKAVALASDDVEAWVLLFDLCEKRNDHAGAADVIARGLAHCPESPALHFYCGKMLKEAGRLPEAITAFENSRRLQPNEARAYIELAMVEFQRGRVEHGLTQIKTALVAEPGNAFAMQVLARYAISTRDEAAARRWMEKLRRYASVSATDLESLADEFRRQFGQAP